MSTTSSVSLPGIDSVADSGALLGFLQKTSRTFALTIPLLDEPLRTEVGLAYLLFRIIDTLEDATLWDASLRVRALADFVRLLHEPDDRLINITVANWMEKPPLAHAGYLELLRAAPQVLRWYARLDGAARTQLRVHLERSAMGMCAFVQKADGQGTLRLATLQELRDYCYAVAGIVGEMLTELFLLSGGERLGRAAEQLRARSVAFGEGLQLVNILKDAKGDAAEGRVYLPPDVLLAEVFVLARADLRAATEYVDILRSWGAPRGLVAFNALNLRLAIATLRLLRDRGLGSKLTRPQVLGLAADVTHALDTGGPLFDET